MSPSSPSFQVADIEKAISGLPQSNATLLEEITEDTKAGGLIHHTFIAGEGELVVIDESEHGENRSRASSRATSRSRRSWSLFASPALPPIAIYNEVEAAGKV